MVYFFKLSSDIKEDVEVRLSAENGQFTMLYQLGQAPSPDNYTGKGSERQPIRIRQVQSPTKNI